MFIFQQSTGRITRDGEVIGFGYAGFGAGKNAPEMQSVPSVGPIPQGFYTIGSAHDDAHLGVHVMALIPDVENEMFGRAGFFWHGCNFSHPDESSHGCIVSGPAVRTAVSSSGDIRLQVIA